MQPKSESADGAGGGGFRVDWTVDIDWKISEKKLNSMKIPFHGIVWPLWNSVKP